MIVRTASYIISNSWIASLQGATIGSFGIGKGFMCNGANSLQKSLFQELNGFQGNDTIASGDDVFLLQKARSFLIAFIM
jgi:hypothetical protein